MICYTSKREHGYVLILGDTDEKNSDMSVSETQASSHQIEKGVKISSIHLIESCQILINIEANTKSVENMANKNNHL